MYIEYCTQTTAEYTLLYEHKTFSRIDHILVTKQLLVSLSVFSDHNGMEQYQKPQ